MKFQNKILLSDLDGTLLNSNRQVSEENIEAIRYFISEGGRFAVATGRDIENILEMLAHVPLNFHCIFSNGSVLFDKDKGEVLAETCLENKNVLPFLERCSKEQPEIGLQIHSNEGTIFYPHYEQVAAETLETHRPFSSRNYEELSKLTMRKVLFITPKGDFSWIERESEDMLEHFDRVNSGKNYYEFLPSGSNKGNMVKKMRQYIGENDKIYAVGDFYNDLEMIKEADFGILCDNAPEELKQYADAITVHHNAHVIVDVVNRILTEN